ncbi:MAG: YeeE/YedE family protein [Planctomycetes bacterium]|nr:YeeE/YedE family protein [Planctomycetota bacterium]
MNLYAQGLLDTPLGFLASLLIGIAFGFWLERAGFGSSRKLAAMFYLRDFAVLQVMFTGLATAAIGLVLLDTFGLFDASAVYRMETSYGPQLVGGAIFGIGFVMGGWCPGTALVGLASGKLDALVFLLGAGAGSLAYAAAWTDLAPLRELGACGVVTLPEQLGVEPTLVASAVVAIALFAFAGVHLFQRARTRRA